MRTDQLRTLSTPERHDLSLWHENHWTVDQITVRRKGCVPAMASLARRHNADHEARVRSRQFRGVLADDSA